MPIYYWHCSTENKLKDGRVTFPDINDSPELKDFWKRIPSRFVLFDEDSGAPSLYMKLKQIRGMSMISDTLIQTTSKFGLVKELFRDSFYSDIYELDQLWFGRAEEIRCIRMKLEDKLGLFSSLISKYIPSNFQTFDRFFETLRLEVLALEDCDFIDLTLGYTPEVTAISWLGDSDQLKRLYEALIEPFKDGNKEAIFLDKVTPYEDFLSVFNGSEGNKIHWQEKVAKNKQPTIVSLLLLFSELKKHSLISSASTAGIRRVIKDHFFNKQGGKLTNLKILAPSTDSIRAKRIRAIVESLSNKK